MSYDSQIDKNRLFFTQCYDPFPVRCPHCTKIKKRLAQCKIYKNFASVWRHIKKGHLDITQAELKEIIRVLNGIFQGYKWQMFPKWKFSEIMEETTTSSFLIDGKGPRIDRLEKFKKIARLLRIQSEFYPKYTPIMLKKMIRLAIGPHDYRILDFYFRVVTDYSEKDKIRGAYDVTQFCDMLGA